MVNKVSEEKNLYDDDEKIEVTETYGFKANIRQRINDVVIRVEALEKMNIPYSITIARLLIFGFVALVILAGVFIYLTSNPQKATYVWLPIIMIAVAAIGVTAQYSLVNPSYGSLLDGSIALLIQIIRRIGVRVGRLFKPNYSGIKTVSEQGVIVFSNGDYGRIFHVDGTTSATAYPSEILQQERQATSYHDGRLRTTTEVHITSSQKQNTEQQLKSLEKLMRKTTDPAKLSVLSQDHFYLSEKVDGVKPTIVQYLLLRDPSEKNLDDSIERLSRFAANGYYYSLRPLNKEESEEILGEILALK